MKTHNKIGEFSSLTSQDVMYFFALFCNKEEKNRKEEIPQEKITKGKTKCDPQSAKYVS